MALLRGHVADILDQLLLDDRSLLQDLTELTKRWYIGAASVLSHMTGRLGLVVTEKLLLYVAMFDRAY